MAARSVAFNPLACSNKTSHTMSKYTFKIKFIYSSYTMTAFVPLTLGFMGLWFGLVKALKLLGQVQEKI